ncbi:MAG: hypothetical protein OXU78_03645, partial [Deltaproteobacteria bacterium]|nr:hypothetical protein [Deltaproteobacteria bacterium]
QAQLGASGEIERTVTILDDDPISARVTGNAADVAESLSARFTVEVTGGGAYTGMVVVPWEVVATAATSDTDAVAADFDYDDNNMADANYPSGTLMVPARGSAVLEIKIFADSDATETGETFAVRLYGSDRPSGTAASGGGGGAISAQNPTPLPMATILSATDAVRVAVSLSGPTEIAEGAAGTYTVTLSGITTPVADIVVSVTVAADTDDATVNAGGADFSGSAFPTISDLTFTSSNWQTTQQFTVTSVQDTSSEAPEVFVASISATGNGSNGLSLGTTSISTRIADDDPLTISIGDGSAEEGEPGDLPIAISGGTPAAPLQVFFAVVPGGTAEAAEYVLPQSPAQVAAAAASSGALRIATVEDTANEGSETLLLRLTGVRSPGGGVVTLGGEVATAPERNATLTITDDDPILAGLSAVAANLAEDAGTADFRIELSGGTRSAPLTLDWAASGDAVFGEDWSGAASSGSLSIAPEASSATLALTLTDDSVEESDENLIITLSNPVGAAGVVSFSPATARVRILASDIVLGPSIRIEAPSCPPGGCAEGQTVMFPVTLRNPPPVDVTVNWRVHLDEDPNTANVLIFGEISGSSLAYTDFLHVADNDLSRVQEDYYFGSIVFRAAQRESRKFVGIDLRLDGNLNSGLNPLVSESPEEFYEVRISVTPDSGANAVRVIQDRATSSIAAGPGIGSNARESWVVTATIEPTRVQEGGQATVHLNVGKDTRNPPLIAVPRQEAVARICITADNPAIWASIRDGRQAASSNDFRVREGGRIVGVDSNFIVSSRGGLTIRCTAVDVLMPRMVGMRVVSIPVEIISDGMQEPDEAMWVFGHPIVADYPQNTGNTIYVTSDVVLALGESRLISAQQQQTARRNLFTIAASPANTRTLSLTGSA